MMAQQQQSSSRVYVLRLLFVGVLLIGSSSPTNGFVNAFVTNSNCCPNNNKNIDLNSSGNKNVFNSNNNYYYHSSSSSSSSLSSPFLVFFSSYSSREQEFPEQYPATYEINTYRQPFENGITNRDAAFVRPLLKNTQLERRPLRVAYDAKWQGWNPTAFHKAVDGQGAAVVLAKCRGEGPFGGQQQWIGGYNPKGWSSTGGARPSVAAFLFYQTKGSSSSSTAMTTAAVGWQKLRKIGGGGLACAKDDPSTGIWLGADGLIIPLQQGSQSKAVGSNLGTYFERGPEKRFSILPPTNRKNELEELKVLVGVYRQGEEIPYSGAVLDFTSG